MFVVLLSLNACKSYREVACIRIDESSCIDHAGEFFSWFADEAADVDGFVGAVGAGLGLALRLF